MSWEIDLWGRLRRSTESARAQYLATEEVHRGVVVSLVSDTAGPDGERAAILRVLEQTNWVLAGPRGAAARLGMKRTTLQSHEAARYREARLNRGNTAWADSACPS